MANVAKRIQALPPRLTLSFPNASIGNLAEWSERFPLKTCGNDKGTVMEEGGDDLRGFSVDSAVASFDFLSPYLYISPTFQFIGILS
jgi:hypothetical protein